MLETEIWNVVFKKYKCITSLSRHYEILLQVYRTNIIIHRKQYLFIQLCNIILFLFIAITESDANSQRIQALRVM